jgi:hypothetical protein
MKVQDVDWNIAFHGLAQHKPRYGMVIHTVPTSEIDITEDKIKDTIAQLQEENSSRHINITKIAPLRWITQHSKVSPPEYQSIIVFTDNANAANACLSDGFIVNSQIKRAKIYAPQCQISQCFKCHGYGHRATQCKKSAKCGKCGNEDHNSNQCNSEEPKCAQCDGPHAAWHHECPKRMAERERLAKLKKQIPSRFTE